MPNDGRDVSFTDQAVEEMYAEAERRSLERRRRRRQRGRPSRQTARRPLGELRSSTAGRRLVAIAAAIAALTVVGLVALWPGSLGHHRSVAFGGPTIAAKVAAVKTVRCAGPTAQACRQIVVVVHGAREPITLGPVSTTLPDLHHGSAVRIARVEPLPGQRALPAGSERYSFVGLDRRGGLLVLAIALLLAALVVVRLRGVLAGFGVILSVLVVTKFAVPAILDGRPAMLVALVASLAVMFTTVLLTNGLSAQSLAAVLGISATLAITCGVAAIAVHLVHLDGRTDELSQYLAQQNSHLSLQGIVLAGMLIGALGVLADTAVTQASAVMALRRANPDADALDLYRGAWAVGRDHLSATIHTLVLAYVGTALPLLLLMRSSAVSFSDAISTQDIAEPIAAAIVGCIALVSAVPLTTGLAAMLVSHVPPEALADAHAGHHH
jgi:uncharacterized membrane protein